VSQSRETLGSAQIFRGLHRPKRASDFANNGNLAVTLMCSAFWGVEAASFTRLHRMQASLSICALRLLNDRNFHRRSFVSVNINYRCNRRRDEGDIPRLYSKA
jgi:hypothetical protein